MDDGPLKPDPAPVRSAMAQLGEANAWMIGDTPDDIRSGVAAGAFAVGGLVQLASRRRRRRGKEEGG